MFSSLLLHGFLQKYWTISRVPAFTVSEGVQCVLPTARIGVGSPALTWAGVCQLWEASLDSDRACKDRGLDFELEHNPQLRYLECSNPGEKRELCFSSELQLWLNLSDGCFHTKSCVRGGIMFSLEEQSCPLCGASKAPAWLDLEKRKCLCPCRFHSQGDLLSCESFSAMILIQSRTN